MIALDSAIIIMSAFTLFVSFFYFIAYFKWVKDINRSHQSMVIFMKDNSFLFIMTGSNFIPAMVTSFSWGHISTITTLVGLYATGITLFFFTMVLLIEMLKMSKATEATVTDKKED